MSEDTDDKLVRLEDHRVDPHLSGPAQCLECKHTWVAVSPVGTQRLECPACGTHKGVWRGTFDPEPGQHVWTCACGNDLFLIQPHRVMCAACGTTGHPFPAPPPPPQEPVNDGSNIVQVKFGKDPSNG